MGNARERYAFAAVMVIVSSVCSAQNLTDAENFIHNLESQVMEISRNAVPNFMNSCELLATCQGNCSRHACTPVKADEGYVCQYVHNNAACYNMNGSLGCQNIRFSLAKSFVRLPTADPNNLTDEANTNICSQRMLDPTLKSVSAFLTAANSTSAFYAVYFGSMEGVQRYFPGIDVPPDTRCIFEPRKRPWFVGASSVKKDVMVLLDTGHSMGDKLPADLLVTGEMSKLSASISIVTELLDTLAYGDRVTVITFTDSGAKTVLPPITITGDATIIQPLKTALQYNVTFENAQGDSNLTSAFILANRTFVKGDALEVILIITDGQIMPVDSGTTSDTKNVFDSIRSLNTLVQIFSFDRAPADAPTGLQKIACDCFGTYEKITSVRDPLWTLRSYFGILARIRLTASNNKPSWTRIYPATEGLENIITVAFPAFADNYTLIGVAAIDVILGYLDPVAQYEFTTALLNHRNTDGVPNLVPPQLPCPFALSTVNQCPDVTPTPNALCPHTDTSGLTFQQRFCNCPEVCFATVEDVSPDSSTFPVWKLALGISSGVVLMFIVCATLAHVLVFRHKISDDDMEQEEFLESLPGLPPRFSYHELDTATNHFINVLGKGGFGTVYSGVLPDGNKIAVKRLGDSKRGQEEFRAEVATIGGINHLCLVRLWGFCSEGAHRMLVYECMENGSLDRWLFGDGNVLEWAVRYQIAMDTAQGLCYLHRDCRHKIIHLDVKPQNILLDDHFHAKVADFGLSKLYDRDMSKVMTRMRGTPGYLAPEWLLQTGITEKCDVWSYGMVLLEIVSGRRNVDVTESLEKWYFPAWAIQCIQEESSEEKSWHEIVDGRIRSSLSDEDWKQVRRLLMVAMWCIQDSPRMRPDMAKVVQMLEGVVEVGNAPLQYEFLHMVSAGEAPNSNSMTSSPSNFTSGASEVHGHGFSPQSEV